jgi:hypothetical protein
MPPVARSYCASRTGSLFIAPDADAVKLQHMAALAKTGEAAG